MSVKQDKGKGILYDVKRDGHLEVGDTIYIYENGSRELVKSKNNG